MNYINSYCNIVSDTVWLNDEVYFKSNAEKFVLNDFFTKLYKHLGIDYRRFFKMDPLSKLGFLASEILLAGSNREQPKPDMGIILFNKNSSLEADRGFQKTIQDKKNFFPSPAEFVYTLPNIVTGEIAIRNKIYGETAFYVLRHFLSDVMSDTIDSALHSAGIKCVLAGWVNVDVMTNSIDCLMTICTAGKNKTGAKKRVRNLPAGLENICFAPEKIEVEESNFYDLYKD